LWIQEALDASGGGAIGAIGSPNERWGPVLPRSATRRLAVAGVTLRHAMQGVSSAGRVEGLAWVAMAVAAHLLPEVARAAGRDPPAGLTLNPKP